MRTLHMTYICKTSGRITHEFDRPGDENLTVVTISCDNGLDISARISYENNKRG